MPPSVVRVIARLNVGGPAQHVVFLTRDLRDRYPTTLVAGPVAPDEADMSALAAREGVAVTWIAELGRAIRPGSDLVALWKLWRLLRRARPRIVHTHTAKAGTLGRLAALMAGVPIRVHTYHGHVFHGYFGPVKGGIFLAIERVLARITTRIVAISPAQQAELAHYLRVAPERVRVIPLGLDLERMRVADPAAARARFRGSIGAGAQDVLVAVVGRLVPIKNHALALEALARLAPRHPRLRFVFIGGGELEASLREQARAGGLADRVIFAGWREDLPEVYAGCDIVALTSDNEGTPVCLIEALAAGRAVISTKVGGVEDVLAGGRYGVLVPPGAAAALAEGLEGLLDEGRRRAMEGRAVDDILRRYGTGRLAADVGRLYDELGAADAVSPVA